MKNILIIEPSSAALELLPTAKAMGLNVFVFNANKDERIIPSNYIPYIDKIIMIDTYDIDLMTNTFHLINNSNLISAIIPGSEYHVPIASELSEKFNLRGVSRKHVSTLRIKSDTRDRLNEKGVRCPRYAIVKNNIELSTASEYVKFPCVIKPVASAGSIHVSRADNFYELSQAYESMQSDPWTELGKGIGNKALVEEYINGEEFSIEGYIDDKHINIISVTKKFLSKEPFFVEMGHIVPANINNILEEKIKNYLNDVIHALEINIGIFHAEIRVDKKGPVLIEIAGRLPGGRISDLIYLAKGINFYEIMLQSYLGLPVKIDLNITRQYAGMCYFELNGKTKFISILGIENLSQAPGFHELKLLKKPGEYVTPLKDFSGRIAYCIFTRPTFEEIATALETAKSTLKFIE